MTLTINWLAVVIGLAMLLPAVRVARGPTVFDRVVGAGAMGTTTLILLCLVGFAAGRLDMFIDIAIAYALLNFVSAVVVAKYLDAAHGREP